jgi:hypothetical protein
VAGYPSFGLAKEGVPVKVEVWKGDLDIYAKMHDVWIQLRGLQPDWCEWDVLDQFTSAFGILHDVDWKSRCHNISEVVRVKVKCRDVSKIPTSKLFGVTGDLY